MVTKAKAATVATVTKSDLQAQINALQNQLSAIEAAERVTLETRKRTVLSQIAEKMNTVSTLLTECQELANEVGLPFSISDQFDNHGIEWDGETDWNSSNCY